MLKKKLVFRVDASRETGSGHVMRCLILADRLTGCGFECSFLCKLLEGHLGDYITSRGYPVFWLTGHESTTEANWKKDAEESRKLLAEVGAAPDWIVVDHYGIDYRWEKAVAQGNSRLLVIDDLANRPHDCDILLDQNVRPNLDSRYDGLVPEGSIKLLGPRYLLLRPDFYDTKYERQRDGKLHRLLLFFGGSDPTDETGKALSAIESIGDNREFDVDVIAGASNPRLEELKTRCDKLSRLKLSIQVENMAERIAMADFALGAGGVAMWERCFLGLPSSVTIVADNQVESVQEAARLGALWNSGSFESTNEKTYIDLLLRAQASPEELIRLGEQARRLTRSSDNGEGFDPVLNAMLSIQST